MSINLYGKIFFTRGRLCAKNYVAKAEQDARFVNFPWQAFHLFKHSVEPWEFYRRGGPGADWLN
jgi:hypothetical protein